MLNQFLKSSQYKNIVFCWAMHERNIIETILSLIDTKGCTIKLISLIANSHSLSKRIQIDIENGVRIIDIINRSLDLMCNYDLLDTEKIDVSNITPQEMAKRIKNKLHYIIYCTYNSRKKHAEHAEINIVLKS